MSFGVTVSSKVVLSWVEDAKIRFVSIDEFGHSEKSCRSMQGVNHS